MGWIENLLARWGYAPATKADQVTNAAHLLAYADVEKFSLPDPSLYRNQADLYRRLSWVAIAIDIVARTCASQALSVVRDLGEETEEQDNHPFERLLKKPNPLTSRREFLESTIAYYKLTGNAYWWLNRTSENVPPSELWLIPSYMIQPQPDGKLYLKGYLYDPGDGQQIALETWEITHFKTFNPMSQFVGLGAIEQIAMISAGDLEMQRWNVNLFGENNARLPGILAFSDPIPDPQWTQLQKEARDKANKREHMMLRGAGKGGVQWLQAAMSQREMEFLKGREFTRDEIFSHLAPGLASMLAVNATEANSKTGKATLAEYAIWPILTAVAETISNDVLPAYGDDLLAEFEDPRVTDRVLDLQEEASYSRVHTINEIRKEKYNDDPLPDPRGELLPAQVGQSAVIEPGVEDNAGDGEQQPNTQRPAENQQPEVETAPEVDEIPAKATGMSVTALRELRLWQEKAIKHQAKGWGLDFEFVTEALPRTTAGRIADALKACQSEDDILMLFAGYTNDGDSGDPLAVLIQELKRANDLLALESAA